MSIPVSPFYERRRRLALGFAAASFLLLGAQLYLGLTGEAYGEPLRAAADPSGLHVFHQVVAAEDEQNPTTRALFLNPRLQVTRELFLQGVAGGLLVEGPDPTIFSGTAFTAGNRRIELGQKWDVKAAVQDRSHEAAWIFGWSDGKIVARRRSKGAWSPEIPVQESAKVEEMTAAMDVDQGPLVAWPDPAAPRIRTAFYDGVSFVPKCDFAAGPETAWDLAPVGGRLILVTHRISDRTFKFLTFGLQCCKECGQPPPPERISFAEPPFALGRRITGLAAAACERELVIFVTRGSPILWHESALEAAVVPRGSLLPPPGAALAPIGGHPTWKRLAGDVGPLALFFSALSLISLGFTMLRDRRARSSAASSPPSANDPPLADLLPRILAQLLDLFLLAPVFLVTADLVNFPTDLFDPNVGKSLLLATAFLIGYFFLLEAVLGGTPGKMILGLRIAAQDGSRASLWAIFLRTLLRPIEASPFFPVVGLVALSLTRRRQRLGDLLARTIVVRDG